MGGERSRWGDWSFMRHTRMCQPAPPQTRTMFVSRVVASILFICLGLTLLYGSIELASFGHRVSAGWPEVEGRVVGREYRSASKGSRGYFVALRFRTLEGALVNSGWTEVQVYLPSWSDSDRRERPPRYMPGETTMLRYDPMEPSRVRVSAEVPTGASAIVLAALGVFLGVYGAWLIRWTMRQRARAISAATTS
jgi:Protein of unknown function (DUF3592)